MLLKKRDDEQIELLVSVSQLKKMYLALFRQLHTAGPAAFEDFDEDDMLITLQTFLQHKAREAGVDVANHADWERFLGVTDAPSCAQRFAGRGND